MHNEVAAKAECGIETFPFILRVSVLVLKILVKKIAVSVSKKVSFSVSPERFVLKKNVSISVLMNFFGPVTQ